MKNIRKVVFRILCLLLFMAVYHEGEAQQGIKQDFIYQGGRTNGYVGPNPAGLDTITYGVLDIQDRLGTVALADLDGDGDLDFISGSNGSKTAGYVHFYENIGTKNSPLWGYKTGKVPSIDTLFAYFKSNSGQNINQARPYLFDIDADGDLDLFLSIRYGPLDSTLLGTPTNLKFHDIQFFKNKGSKSSPLFVYSPSEFPGLYRQNVGEFSGFEFADLDNDGDADMISMGSDSCVYFENTGTKTAAKFIRHNYEKNAATKPASNKNPFHSTVYSFLDLLYVSPKLVDFDADGDLDLWVINDGGFMKVMVNRGTKSSPNFGSPITQDSTHTTLDTIDFGSFNNFDFGDVNNDGVPDLVVSQGLGGSWQWFSGVSFGVNTSVTQVDTPTCKDSTNGSASISVSGGTSPYTITWSNGDTGVTADSLSAGKYYVTIIDAVPDTVRDSITIVEPTLVNATATVSNNVICFGLSNGKASSSASGGNGGYAYLWSNSETTSSTTASLSAGTYTLTVTDSKGCNDTARVVISQPTVLSATATVNSHATSGPSSGSASASGSGGTSPYTYSWSNSATTSGITSLSVGTYTVTVTDANNCTSTDNVTIIDGPSVSATASKHVSCNGLADGSASASVSGGTSPFTYVWSNASTTSSISSLSAGTYTVTITDAGSQTATSSVTITQPTALTASTSVNNHVSCNTGLDGSLTANGSGGTSPYTYAWSNSATTATAASLAASTYTVTVTDANGCTATDNETITEPSVLVATAVVDSHSVKGPNTGGATASAVGGTSPYTFNWNNSATTASINAIDSGQYIVTITDANGCTDKDTIEILSRATITFKVDSHVTCNGLANGGASATVVGGTAPYKLRWNNGDTTLFADSLSAGTYTFRVIDAAQDTVIDSIVITEPALLVASSVVDKSVSCNGGSDGGATASATGGTTPYTYMWSNAATTASITSVSGGTYTVTVTDANGCTATSNSTITEPTALTATVALDQSVTCNGLANGEVSASPSGGTSPYTYLWSSAGTTASITSLPAGTYTVTVTDANGCTTTDQETVTEPAILSVSTVVDSNVTCNGFSDGGITASSTGGTTPYTYLWSNATTVASATNLVASTYTVTLTDANGCTTTSSKTVTEPTLLVAGSITGDDVVCSGVAPNKATQVSAASGGTGSISYQWQLSSDNANWSDIASATASEYQPAGRAGNTWYRRVATDANGCGPVMTNAIKITINGQPTASFTSTAGCQGKQTTFTNNSTVTSGNISAYNWSFGDKGTSNQQNPINVYKSSGSYSVQLIVTTDSGCVDTTSTTISVNPVPSVDFTASVECEGTATDFTNKSSISNGTNSYSWNLGDNNSSSSTSPSHSYTNSGYYTVQLTATSNNGCVDSISKTVQVKQVAKPNFSATSVCEGQTTNFTNLSTNASTYSWDFDDNGNGSKQANPKNKYKNSGSYTVVLTATSSDGCSDTAERTVSVYSLPTAGFTGTEVCLGQSTVFTNTSSGASKYQWIFDNGTSSTASAPSLVYGQAGNYKVELTATTANGCVDVATNTITVNALPSVSFTTADVCQSDALTTVNTTTGANSYSWSFGDGNTSALRSPTHNYSTHGQYRVKLEASTSKGCVDSSSTTINAWAEPRVAFNASNVCLGHPMTFNNTSSIAEGSMTYNWSLGDGSSTGNASPIKTYGNFGPYAVQLVATTNRGCKDSITSTVTVYNAPTIDFDVPNVCFADTLKTLNKSIISSSYTWNLGDGQTSAAQDTVNIYSKAGDYTIQLIGTTAEGCMDSISKQVTIYPKPIAGFDAEDECDQTAVSFANTSYNANITSHNWSYGDGNNSQVINPNHTYTKEGSYTAQLITISDNGCADTLSKTITVHPNPVVSFTNTTECDYDSTRFTNNTSIATGSNTYQWNLGTGASSIDANPVYHYPQAGSYVVSLQATSDQGCTKTTQAIVVVNPSPKAGIATSNICEGFDATLISSSTLSGGTIATYTWDLGDGNTSTDQDPVHLYKADGTYNLELIAGTDKGCVDTTTSTIIVWNKPTANFTTPDICFGEVSNFTDGTTDGQDYLYDFGDKWGISTLAQPQYTYEAPGTYNPILYVTSSNGCKDTVTKSIEIYSLPTAQFSINHHCFGEDFTPQDQSQGNVSDWSWEYEDGNTSTDQNPTHQYGKDGSYNVKLQVEDNNGCTDSLRKTVVVWPLPIVGVRTDTLVSKGYTVPMLATGGVEYKWSPVDNLDKPLKANPTATVIEDQTYTVTVANQFGCTRDTFVNLKVREDYTLEPSNIMTPDGNGQNDAWIVEKAQYYNDVEVLVFDRWGRIVYQSNSYNNSWEGTGTNGEPLPDGAYYYVVKVPADREEYKGSITIFR